MGNIFRIQEKKGHRKKETQKKGALEKRGTQFLEKGKKGVQFFSSYETNIIDTN